MTRASDIDLTSVSTPAHTTPQQRHRARLTVARNATDPDDHDRLLDMIGLKEEGSDDVAT